MPDQLKKYTDPLKARWDILTPPQRYRLLGVVAVVLVALILVLWLAFRTPWETIVTRENSQVINPMRIALDDAGIRNRTINHGSGLQVDRRRSDDAMIAIQVGGAAPNSEHFTWENALDTGLGTTDDERRRRDILGMEGQIERQLTAMNDIVGANVTLSIPNVRPFDRNAPEPTAAVTLVVAREFSPTQGRNLALLVAGNVSRLTLDNITIIDQYMRPIHSGDAEAHSLADHTQQIQIRHMNHVQMATTQLLSPVFDDVTVVFNPVFEDTLMTEAIRTVYSAPVGMDGLGLMSSYTGSRAEYEGSMAGLEPGLPNNTAQTPNYLMPGGGLTSASLRDWARTYLVDSLQEITQSGPGWVDAERSMGAVIAVIDRPIDQEHWLASTPEGEEQRTVSDWNRFKNENTTPTSVNGEFYDFEEFHELIASAMGIPADNVSLIIMQRYVPFDTITTPIDWATILMMIVLALLLLMLLFGLLRRQRAAGEDEESLEPQLAVEDLLVSTQLDEARENETQELEEIDYFKENEIKKHIEKFVNEKPEAVAALLRNWINVEEW
ncbi:MAG: hypothetical protein FWC89_08220 [Defluviitaleaceae bacterium]|nr:hypothetical protein [Defluviitaleaceae bacterium]